MRITNHICDRCGATKEGAVRVDIPFGERKKLVEAATWLSLSCATGYKTNLDLCQNCMESFAKWMSDYCEDWAREKIEEKRHRFDEERKDEAE